MVYKKSILINAFEEFYLLLLKKIELIKKDLFFNVNDSLEEKDQKVSELSNSFYLFIKETDANIIQQGGKIASDSFKEVMYVMVSLADELLLSFQWDGKSYWRRHLLEDKIFQTNQAGEKFFSNLEEFMNTSNFVNKEIAMIYLYALSLGFKGKMLYEPNYNESLKEIKQKLYYLIYNKNPKLDKLEGVLFQKTEENIVKEKISLNKSKIYTWKNALLICLVSYLGMSTIIWYSETNLTSQILRKSKEAIK